MGKWDVTIPEDYEESTGGYSGEAPKPGIYVASLVDFDEHNGKSDTSMKFVFEIEDDEDYEGWRGWLYSDLDNAKWKTEQIVFALNGGKKGVKTSLDPANKDRIIKRAKKVKIRVKNETYEGERRGKITLVLPLEATTSKAKKRDADDEDPWDDED